MNELPEVIHNFIKKQHIVSLSAHSQQDFWAANCFYAFDEKKVRLIIMTKTTTRHAMLMLENNHVVGTIAGQTNQIKEMEGIQFSAIAHLLEDHDERNTALKLYATKQPLAKFIKGDIWEVVFTEIKHTWNKFAFATKTNWNRNPKSF